MEGGFAAGPNQTSRLYEVTVDDSAIGHMSGNVAHEREVAIHDLLEENRFKLPDRKDGPYRLHIAIVEDRLSLRIGNAEDENLVTHLLSLTPFKKIIKDYFVVCESYYEAIKSAPPARIQALDMGRRGLHDEGSTVLMERLKGKIDIDFDTARRLFTLVSVLHWKG